MMLLGLIGHPLSHSFSENFFREKFKNPAWNNTIAYKNFDLDSVDELPALIEERSNLIGLNVTIPFKEAVLPYLDVLSDEAKQIGAVNTLIISRSNDSPRIIGHNTDWIGFKESLQGFIGNEKPRALVLGSGGSSKAIQYVLSLMEIDFFVVSRHPNPEMNNWIEYSDISEGMVKDRKLIINTTPLGMFPAIDSAPPLPYQSLTTDHYLFDLIYNPSETVFLTHARNAGANLSNGFKMLKLQAEASWSLWSLHHSLE